MAGKNLKNRLTISSVYHSSATRDLLKFNLALTKELNPGIDFNWVVADNSLGTVPGLDPQLGFTVIPGARRIKNVPSWARGSYHHAAGIHKTIPHLKTRFALVLDSDFFLVRPGWIAGVIEHMLKKNLHFFGAPYHPSRFIKYRYTSSINCIFIDSDRINLKELDFSPAYENALAPRSYLGAINKRIRKIAMAFPFGERLKIEKSRDTGYKISKFFSKPEIFELAEPVFKPKQPISFFDKILPDRFSYVPKKPGYYSEKSFSELGSSNVSSFGWEEYLWGNAPFAVHLNANRDRERRNIIDELAVISRLFPVK